MAATTAPDIFISHSSKDDAAVSHLAAELRRAGFSVWVDHEEGVPVGTSAFDSRVQQALNDCRRGLLVLTSHSARSAECTGEWRHLLTQHKLLYVARLADFPQPEFPSRLAIMQYADLRRNYAQGLDALLTALQHHRALDPAHPGTGIALRSSGAFPGWQLSLELLGRDTELSAASQLLPQARTVVLTGAGGVGKTRLAAELAAQAVAPDGVVWHLLAKADTPAAAATDLKKLTQRLREHLVGTVQPDDPDEEVWQLLGASAALLVLDNAEDCQHPRVFIEQLNLLNQHAAGLQVLVTSRHLWPGLKAASPVPLAVPTADDAIRILEAMLAARLPLGRVRPTPAQVQVLAEAARYHPRLLEATVTWLLTYPVPKVTEWLRTRKGRQIEEVLADVMQHTLELLAAQLPDGPLALAALHRLLVCRGGFDYTAAEALLADLPGAIDTLDILTAWNLLRFDGSHYDTDLLTREAEAPDEAAYPLHYAHYEALARQHNAQQDYVGLVPELENLEAAFEWAMRVGDIERAYWLVNAAREVLHNRGRFGQELQWLERVEQALSDTTTEAIRAALWNSFGISHIAQPLSNRSANLLRAIAAYQAALRHYTEQAAPLAFATTQSNLGTAYADLAQVEEREANLRRAIAAYQAALRHYTEQAAPLGFAMTQSNLGIVLELLGDLPAAIRCWQQAERAFRQFGDPTRADQLQAGIAEAEETLRNQSPTDPQ